MKDLFYVDLTVESAEQTERGVAITPFVKVNHKLQPTSTSFSLWNCSTVSWFSKSPCNFKFLFNERKMQRGRFVPRNTRLSNSYNRPSVRPSVRLIHPSFHSHFRSCRSKCHFHELIRSLCIYHNKSWRIYIHSFIYQLLLLWSDSFVSNLKQPPLT